jgi:hypothetical protein
MSLGKVRSWLYWAASMLGDVQAVRKGPRAVGKRMMRRAAGCMTGRLLGRMFR